MVAPERKKDALEKIFDPLADAANLRAAELGTQNSALLSQGDYDTADTVDLRKGEVVAAARFFKGLIGEITRLTELLNLPPLTKDVIAKRIGAFPRRGRDLHIGFTTKPEDNASLIDKVHDPDELFLVSPFANGSPFNPNPQIRVDKPNEGLTRERKGRSQPKPGETAAGDKEEVLSPRRFKIRLTEKQEIVVNLFKEVDQEKQVWRYPRSRDISRQYVYAKGLLTGLTDSEVKRRANRESGAIINAREEFIRNGFYRIDNPKSTSTLAFDSYLDFVLRGHLLTPGLNRIILDLEARAIRRQITFGEYSNELARILVRDPLEETQPSANSISTKDSTPTPNQPLREDGEIPTISEFTPLEEWLLIEGITALERSLPNDRRQALITATQRSILIDAVNHLVSVPNVLSGDLIQAEADLTQKLEILRGPNGHGAIATLRQPRIQPLFTIWSDLIQDSLSKTGGNSSNQAAHIQFIGSSRPAGIDSNGSSTPVGQDSDVETPTKNRGPKLTKAEMLVAVTKLLNLKADQLKRRGLDLTKDLPTLRTLESHYRTDPKTVGNFQNAQRTVSGKLSEIERRLQAGALKIQDLQPNLQTIAHLLFPKFISRE